MVRGEFLQPQERRKCDWAHRLRSFSGNRRIDGYWRDISIGIKFSVSYLRKPRFLFFGGIRRTRKFNLISFVI